MVAVENHVHALEHEALGIALEGENALAAQNVLALLLDQGLHPGKELVRIERRLGLERDRLHFFVVIVLEPARRMLVIVIMLVVIVIVTVIMAVVMIVTVGLEKFGLDLQDAIEIQGGSPRGFPPPNPHA